MRARLLANIVRSENAAVAPTVALSLFGLIAVGGVAFDYSRMATLNTELQQGADQAALAAASQLDHISGAMTRATDAANKLISNPTLFANDRSQDGTAIKIASVVFYEDKSKTKIATADDDAGFVQVTVVSRRANFALTPIVGYFFSDMNATAFAGVDSAICGVVPFFICNPTEPSSNTDHYYPVTIAPGTGIKLIEGGTQKSPGNFGFLAYVDRGANSLAEALGADKLYDQCTATDFVDTEPGKMTSVYDSLNARFDMPGGACKSPPCSPSTNERKDLVRPTTSCTWQENPSDSTNFGSKRYRPISNAALDPSITPEIMGFPRDICHASSASAKCSHLPGDPVTNDPNGQIGDGVWDRAAYFRSNHPTVNWTADPDLGPNVSRYKTYLWEAEDPAARLAKKNSGTSGLAAYGTPQAGICNPPGISPSTGQDRRRMTAAVVNCHAYGKINGRKSLPIAGYIDVFLVEPSIARTKCGGGTGDTMGCSTSYTSNTDIYVEVIGTSGTAEGGGAPQITRRDIPRLIE